MSDDETIPIEYFIGIDPSTVSTGMCLLHHGILVEHHVITSTTTGNGLEKGYCQRKLFSKQLKNWMKQYKLYGNAKVTIEKPLFHHHTTKISTNTCLGAMHGQVYATSCEVMKVEPTVLDVSTARSHFGLRGSAATPIKTVVINYFATRTGVNLDRFNYQQKGDIADAYIMALYEFEKTKNV